MNVETISHKPKIKSTIKTALGQQESPYQDAIKSSWIQPLVGAIVMSIWVVITYSISQIFVQEVLLCCVMILGLLILKAIHATNTLPQKKIQDKTI